MKLDTPRLSVSYVDSQAALDHLTTELSKTQAVAIDAERASGFRYSQKAYLIQIAIEEMGIWLVDPTLEQLELSRFAEELGKKTWLLHAATQDLPCLADLNLYPKAIIDTELSARLAGLERVGLGSLCESLLELELAKEHSAADWSKRPLSQEMLDYAALDVDVMFDLWAAIEALLIAQGKRDWAEQEFQHLLEFKPKPQAKEPWRHLPGMIKIKDLTKLKIAASLWLTRDALAREQDIAPGRLIPDRSISAAAMQAPKSKSELAGNSDFQGRASRSLLNTWWQAIQESVNLEIELENREKPTGVPNHKSWERRFPEAHARLEKVRPLIVDLAKELGLPVENLLTPDYLRRVLFEPSQDLAEQLAQLGARKWQIELTTATIARGLAELQNQDA